MKSINVSSEAILRNTFALEFRIYQKNSLEKPSFWIKNNIFPFSFQNLIRLLVLDERLLSSY